MAEEPIAGELYDAAGNWLAQERPPGCGSRFAEGVETRDVAGHLTVLVSHVCHRELGHTGDHRCYRDRCPRTWPAEVARS